MTLQASAHREEVYDSQRRGPVALEELRNLVRYKDLILQLVRRDIVARYKRSALGIGWTMLNPLGMMVILTLVFSTLFQTVKGYPAYLLSGLVAWTFFSQATAAAMSQMVWGSALLQKIYLPRTAFVVSAIGTALVNFLLSLVPLFLILLAVGLPIRWTVVFLPVPMLLLAAFTLGLGLLLSAWGIYYADVFEMYQVILTGWMYLTPILYPESVIPEAYRFWMFHLNPMYYLIELFRQPVYNGMIPSIQLLGASVAIALGTLAIGWLVFSARLDEFTYRI